MTDKTLKDKAIKYNGKDYVQVKDRIEYFNTTYPDGSITTTIVKDEGDIVQIKAYVMPDTAKEGRLFTGHAEEIRGQGFVNKTSALENCETSAIGRALAMMGIGVIDSVASMDEINIANRKASQDKPYWKKAKESEENLVDMVNMPSQDDLIDSTNIDDGQPTIEQIDEFKTLAALAGYEEGKIKATLTVMKTKELADKYIAKVRG